MSDGEAKIVPTAKEGLATTVQIKTHDAVNIPDGTFWKIHSICLVFIVISVVAIFVAKGPRRRDAIAAMKKSS